MGTILLADNCLLLALFVGALSCLPRWEPYLCLLSSSTSLAVHSSIRSLNSELDGVPCESPTIHTMDKTLDI